MEGKRLVCGRGLGFGRGLYSRGLGFGLLLGFGLDFGFIMRFGSELLDPLFRCRIIGPFFLLLYRISLYLTVPFPSQPFPLFILLLLQLLFLLFFSNQITLHLLHPLLNHRYLIRQFLMLCVSIFPLLRAFPLM